MNQPLKGRVALVTGGARDVGKAISLGLAAQGAAVVVNYHRSGTEAEAVAAEIRQAGGQAMAIGCDISNRQDVQAMVDRTEIGRAHV